MGRKRKRRNRFDLTTFLVSLLLIAVGAWFSGYWQALLLGIGASGLAGFLRPVDRSIKRALLRQGVRRGLAFAVVVAAGVPIFVEAGNRDASRKPTSLGAVTTTTTSTTTTADESDDVSVDVAPGGAPSATTVGTAAPTTVPSRPSAPTVMQSMQGPTVVTHATPTDGTTQAAAPPTTTTPPVVCDTAYDQSEPLEAAKNHLSPGGYQEEVVQLGARRLIRFVSAQAYRLADHGHSADASLPPAGAEQSVRIELRADNRLLASKNVVTSTVRPVEWSLVEPVDARAHTFVTLRVVNLSDWSVHVSWVSGNPYPFGELLSSATGPHPTHELGGRIDACDG